MIETIEFKGELYPKFQSEGFAAQFAFPFAKHFLKGRIMDIGCNRPEWAFPNSTMVDPVINPFFNATNLPENVEDESKLWDGIFSSHVLEHLNDWVGVLDYWLDSIKEGGVIFLYLPDPSQKYWLPWNNRKHVNLLTAQMIHNFFVDRGCAKVFSSGVDLNNSFYVVCEK
jgi:predicted SAM-dependent methyltransferase